VLYGRDEKLIGHHPAFVEFCALYFSWQLAWTFPERLRREMSSQLMHPLVSSLCVGLIYLYTMIELSFSRTSPIRPCLVYQYQAIALLQDCTGFTIKYNIIEMCANCKWWMHSKWTKISTTLFCNIVHQQDSRRCTPHVVWSSSIRSWLGQRSFCPKNWKFWLNFHL